jgi:hypothetical protein
VLGVHDVDVQQNHVANNDFFGIALVDYCLVTAGTEFNCADNPPPAPSTTDFVRVVDNTLVNNHGAPPPGPFQGVAADILEIGGGPNNCFSGNTIDNTPPLPVVTIPDPLSPICQ